MLTATPGVKADRRRRAADRSRKRRWANGDHRCASCVGSGRRDGKTCGPCGGTGRMRHPGLTPSGAIA